MAKRLVAISLTMGFVKSNSAEMTLALSQWIKEQFGDLSMQEVALAFDLVTAKKIGQEIKHYNTFSKQYIGEVLNAFKEFRNKQMKLFKEMEANKLLQEATPGATGREMYESIKKTALDTGKIMKMADWTGAYNYAWSQKNLIYRMDEQERNEYKQGVIEDMKTEQRAGFISEVITEEKSLQAECHKRLMQAHFQELIDKQI